MPTLISRLAVISLISCASAAIRDGDAAHLVEQASAYRAIVLNAAERGDTNAQNTLGYLYQTGEGVPKNGLLAVKWYRRAADGGHVQAQTNLALILSRGDGVPKNIPESIKWYRKAADQGHVVAQIALASIYFNGDGVPTDVKTAMKWFSKAAEQGSITAQDRLASIYATGKGVPKDEVEALVWLNIIAASGDDEDIQSRDKMEEKLGRDASLAAQKRSNELFKQIERNLSTSGKLMEASEQEGFERTYRKQLAKTRATEAWTKAVLDEQIEREVEVELKAPPQRQDSQASLKPETNNEGIPIALANGFAYEKAHQWSEARSAYKESMDLQPDLIAAQVGFERTGMVIRALIRYERYVGAAVQLANKADFQGAIKRFNDAMAVKPSYLVNSERVNQLHSLLMAQNKPVDVTFKSDGNTWVQITNFRQPSKFDTAAVKVLPGDYEIIGRRRGYRDVQMTLQVRNGTPPPTVTIACNETTVQ